MPVLPPPIRSCWEAGLNPCRRLAEHNGHPWLAASGDLQVTGPTMTNVNDLMALFVFE